MLGGGSVDACVTRVTTSLDIHVTSDSRGQLSAGLDVSHVPTARAGLRSGLRQTTLVGCLPVCTRNERDQGSPGAARGHAERRFVLTKKPSLTMSPITESPGPAASHRPPRVTVPRGHATWPWCEGTSLGSRPPVPGPYLQRDHLHEDGEVGEV